MRKTIIIRHRRENLKKCSLRGLETRSEFLFFTYPDCAKEPFSLDGYVLLDLEGLPLTKDDAERGIVLIDGTWRLSEKILSNMLELQKLPRRSIPVGFQTAYPRRQPDCKRPNEGLASIEALFIAYWMTGKPTDNLLDHYYWKETFLNKNKFVFTST